MSNFLSKRDWQFTHNLPKTSASFFPIRFHRQTPHKLHKSPRGAFPIPNPLPEASPYLTESRIETSWFAQYRRDPLHPRYQRVEPDHLEGISQVLPPATFSLIPQRAFWAARILPAGFIVLAKFKEPVFDLLTFSAIFPSQIFRPAKILNLPWVKVNSNHCFDFAPGNVGLVSKPQEQIEV